MSIDLTQVDSADYDKVILFSWEKTRGNPFRLYNLSLFQGSSFPSVGLSTHLDRKERHTLSALANKEFSIFSFMKKGKIIENKRNIFEPNKNLFQGSTNSLS